MIEIPTKKELFEDESSYVILDENLGFSNGCLARHPSHKLYA